MSTFRVGQRVRFVTALGRDGLCASRDCPLGHEGVIVARGWGGWEWIVDLPTAPLVAGSDLPPTQYFAMSHNLAPLTDPRATDFCADMERFASLTKNKILLTTHELSKVVGGAS